MTTFLTNVLPIAVALDKKFTKDHASKIRSKTGSNYNRSDNELFVDAILTGFKKSLSKQGQLIVCENGYDDTSTSFVTHSAVKIDELGSSDPHEASDLGKIGADAAITWMREQDGIEEYSLRCEAALEAAYSSDALVNCDGEVLLSDDQNPTYDSRGFRARQFPRDTRRRKA
jgi:hypothetical protein